MRRTPFLITLALLALAGCSSSGPVSYSGNDDSATPDLFTDGQEEELAVEDSPNADDSESGELDLPAPDSQDDESGLPDAEPDEQAEVDGGQEADATIPPQPLYQVTVVKESALPPWDKVILFELAHPGLTGEKFIPKVAISDPDIAALFDGATTPPSGRFLLHVGPGCTDQPAAARFLVPGAGTNAQTAFVEPAFFASGHVQPWIAAGRCLFAITFPHPFGDNFNQALQLGAAIEQGRLLSGLPAIDLVAHSKGGIVAVTLLTGLAAQEVGAFPESGVDRLFLLGTPLGGLDFSFRHPAFNYPAELYGWALPSSWDKILEWGLWKDIFEDSIYGGAYTGLLQLLAAWDDEYPLTMVEQDWQTTYYGGTGFVSHSLGIAKAIEMGGNFIARLNEGKLPPTVAVHVASGGSALVGATLWETSGPSDGLVFKASAQFATVLPQGAELKHFSTLNHWELLTAAPVRDWIDDAD